MVREEREREGRDMDFCAALKQGNSYASNARSQLSGLPNERGV